VTLGSLEPFKLVRSFLLCLSARKSDDNSFFDEKQEGNKRERDIYDLLNKRKLNRGTYFFSSILNRIAGKRRGFGEEEKRGNREKRE
jgi:hypothetical protein